MVTRASVLLRRRAPRFNAKVYQHPPAAKAASLRLRYNEAMAGSTVLRTSVRVLYPEDAVAWHALQAGIYCEQQWFIGDTPPSVEALSRKLLSADASSELYLGALADGALVGWLELHRYSALRLSHVAVVTLAVALPYRRQGLGRQLLQESCRWAWRVGIEKLQLNVRAANLAAQALYLAEGFVLEGRELRQIRQGKSYEDNLLMAKFLKGYAGP